MSKVLIVHGAGMNLRGKTQLDIFGPMTLPEYDVHIRRYASELGIEVEFFHSNIEGEVINKFYEAHERGVDAAIINPAGYTTGYPALRQRRPPGRRMSIPRGPCVSSCRFPIIHKLPYDPLKSFAWVAMLAFGPNVLAVTQSLPVKSLKELIALAKARPGQLVYASTGVGSNAHFGTELLKHMTGTDMLHVPYKGGGPALIDTIAGQAQLCLSSLIQAIGHIRSGKLRALATSSGKRSLILPDVPTISEAGVPGYETANWWGVAAPRGTPTQVVDRLNAEIKAVLLTPDTEKRLINEGAEPALKTPAELGSYVAAEMAKWAQVARIAGIRGE